MRGCTLRKTLRLLAHAVVIVPTSIRSRAVPLTVTVAISISAVGACGLLRRVVVEVAGGVGLEDNLGGLLRRRMEKVSTLRVE